MLPASGIGDNIAQLGMNCYYNYRELEDSSVLRVLQ